MAAGGVIARIDTVTAQFTQLNASVLNNTVQLARLASQIEALTKKIDNDIERRLAIVEDEHRKKEKK